jgi:drug/metabolite transporter (DMT)-like permease
MAIAGIGWGVYSLLGRGGGDPLAATSGNFLRACAIVVPFSLLTLGDEAMSPRGAGLAVASGALASGLGYAVWYSALPSLTRTRAALVQLSVPLLAAIGGVLAMGETITQRLTLASFLVLGSIGVGVVSRRPPAR